jgi:hypothetical protein
MSTSLAAACRPLATARNSAADCPANDGPAKACRSDIGRSATDPGRHNAASPNAIALIASPSFALWISYLDPCDVHRQPTLGLCGVPDSME